MQANLEQAIAYIRQHGGTLELARLHATLGEKAAIEEASQQVAALQNPDGGWPYRQQEGQPSSLAATHHTLTWLAELGLRSDPAAQRGLDFLLASQQPDGSWRESEQILNLKPPDWMSPENVLANAYLTADSAYHLAVGRDSQLDAVANACNYLYQLELEEQFPQTIWIMGALFTIAEGEESEVAQATREYLEAGLDSQWDAGALAWLLNTYLNAGIGSSTPLLTRARALLENAQQPNGSFSSDDGDPFTLDVTIQAVRALQAASAV
jgi:Squalene-hopene cyclase C-terminal domain